MKIEIRTEPGFENVQPEDFGKEMLSRLISTVVLIDDAGTEKVATYVLHKKSETPS